MTALPSALCAGSALKVLRTRAARQESSYGSRRSFQRLQVSEQVGQLLGRKIGDQAFGHDRQLLLRRSSISARLSARSTPLASRMRMAAALSLTTKPAYAWPSTVLN